LYFKEIYGNKLNENTDISKLLKNNSKIIRNTKENINNIQFNQFPFNYIFLNKEKEILRCQFENGTLLPTAINCEDELENESCLQIFGIKDEEIRSKNCLHPELIKLAKRCAWTCLEKIMMAVCEHTCGFCTLFDECFDLSNDCSSLFPLCFNRQISPLFRQKCPLTCGLCKPIKSSEEENNENEIEAKKSGEIIVLVRKNDQQKCEDILNNCENNKHLCNDENYSKLLKKQCSKTCGNCSINELKEKTDFVKNIKNKKQLNRPPAINNKNNQKIIKNVKNEWNKKENYLFSSANEIISNSDGSFHFLISYYFSYILFLFLIMIDDSSVITENQAHFYSHNDITSILSASGGSNSDQENLNRFSSLQFLDKNEFFYDFLLVTHIIFEDFCNHIHGMHARIYHNNEDKTDCFVDLLRKFLEICECGVNGIEKVCNDLTNIDQHSKLLLNQLTLERASYALMLRMYESEKLLKENQILISTSILTKLFRENEQFRRISTLLLWNEECSLFSPTDFSRISENAMELTGNEDIYLIIY
ncbi:hypothetical protein Mgra_00000470, partial [Meloidogyne graminicola]